MHIDYATCKLLRYYIKKVHFQSLLLAVFILSLKSPLYWNTAVKYLKA